MGGAETLIESEDIPDSKLLMSKSDFLLFIAKVLMKKLYFVTETSPFSVCIVGMHTLNRHILFASGTLNTHTALVKSQGFSVS